MRKFRQSLLELRRDPELAGKLFARKDRVYAAIVPGFDARAPGTPGAVYFAIGPDKQLDAWSEFLRASAGGARLHKLYARDFWM